METTALGAAYLAGRAAGLCPDLEGFAATWKRDRRFEPAMPANNAPASGQAGGRRGPHVNKPLIRLYPAFTEKWCHDRRPTSGSVMIPARYVEFQIHQLIVLVVDDNAFMRKMVRSLLTNIGVRKVYEAS